MKNSDMKIIAIILAVALFFTIITSNAVSVASVILLAKNGTAATDAPATDEGNGGSASTGSTSTGSASTGSAATGSTGSTGSTATGSTGSTGSTSTDSTAAGNTGSTGSTSTDAPAAGDADKPADNAGAAGQAEMSKTQILDLYRNAAKSVRNGKAGFSRKTWQKIQSIDLGAASSLVQPIIEKFMTTEEEATVKTYPAEEAKDKMPVSTFTDGDVQSATVETKGNNYVVTIVMNDEQSPPKDGTVGVAAIAGYEILYMEDVKKEVENLGLDVKNESINYKAFRTVAEITKDGKFVSIRQDCDGDLAATVKVLVDVNAKGVLQFNTHYTDFVY